MFEQKVDEQLFSSSICNSSTALLRALGRRAPSAILSPSGSPGLQNAWRSAPLPQTAWFIPEYPRIAGTCFLSLVNKLKSDSRFLSCPSRADLPQAGQAPAYLRMQKINFSVMNQNHCSLCCQEQTENRDRYMGVYRKLTSFSSISMNGPSGLAGAGSDADARAPQSSDHVMF